MYMYIDMYMYTDIYIYIHEKWRKQHTYICEKTKTCVRSRKCLKIWRGPEKSSVAPPINAFCVCCDYYRVKKGRWSYVYIYLFV